MTTFKQFISESTRTRLGDILYSGRDTAVLDAMKHHEKLEKLVSILNLENFYQNQKLHAEIYGGMGSKYAMHINIPLPNGLSGDDLKLFIDIVEQQAGKLFDIMSTSFKNSDRKSWPNAEAFISSVDRRKGKKETSGDVMSVVVKVLK